MNPKVYSNSRLLLFTKMSIETETKKKINKYSSREKGKKVEWKGDRCKDKEGRGLREDGKEVQKQGKIDRYLHTHIQKDRWIECV